MFHDPTLPSGLEQRLLGICSELAGLEFQVACLRLELLQRKANFNPAQPRVPRGSPSGGQWTNAGGGGDRTGSTAPDGPRAEPRFDVLRPSDLGDSGGPPLEEPPQVPQEAPSTAASRNVVVKRAAKWLLKAAARHAIPEIGLYLDILDAATWLHESFPYIQAYLEQPKSLDELRRAVSKPARGYDLHHIV